MQQFATIVQTLNLASTQTLTVDGISGAPCRIFGLVARNTSGTNTINIAKADGTAMFSFTIANNTSFEVKTPFYADAGLRVSATTPSANIELNVFHSHAGS